MIRRRRTWLIVGLVMVIASAGLGPQAYARHYYQRAEEQLRQHDPDAASKSLEKCRRIWANDVTVLIYSSRAARLAGDLAAAEGFLRQAQRQTKDTTDEIAFEWALTQASSGNIFEVDEYLQGRISADPANAPIVWESLVTGYLRVYRILDAMATLNHWLEREPNNARALELRGITYVTGKGVQRGAEDFRKALEIAPEAHRCRQRLVDSLLDLGSFDEAVPHLQRLIQVNPANTQARAQLARCQNMLGQGELARRTLDDALSSGPDNAIALRTRGQFALADGDPTSAERYLRRAAALVPHEYQTQYLLFQAIQQQEGRATDAERQLKLAEEVKDLTERLSELRSRKLAERPLDPALHTEMGILLLRTDNVEAGEIWLLSALALRPDYAPAHAALAEHYSRQGNAEKSAYHRSRVVLPPKLPKAK